MMLGLQTVPPPAAAAPQAGPLVAPNLPSAYRELQTRAAVLEAQRGVLVARTRLENQPIRTQAERDLLGLDMEMARVKAQLAVMDQQGGAPTALITVPPPPPLTTPWGIDPDAITAVFVLTAIAVLIPFSIGIARRLWRHPVTKQSPGLEDRLMTRLNRLEQAVDAVAIEVERISESQRFVARVLTERPAAPPAPVELSGNASAIADAKPFLALGAGPLEPIRAAERQTVKQSVTPH